jgi:hypothetical protein
MSSPAPRSSSSTETSPILSARSSSITPTRSGSGSTQVNLPRVSAVRYTPLRPVNGFTHTHSGSRDSAPLRTHHRSSASSSEPSLIPGGNEARIRELLTLLMRYT